MHRVFPGSSSDDVFNHASGKAQSAVVIQLGAQRQDDVKQLRKGIANAGVLKNSQRRLMNSGEVVIIEWAVLSTLHAGLDRGTVTALKARLRLGFAVGRTSTFGPGLLCCRRTHK